MAESNAQQQSYVGVAIAFFAIAVSMGLTMHNWAIALPFGVLAIVFLVISRRPAADVEQGTDRDES